MKIETNTTETLETITRRNRIEKVETVSHNKIVDYIQNMLECGEITSDDDAKNSIISDFCCAYMILLKEASPFTDLSKNRYLAEYKLAYQILFGEGFLEEVSRSKYWKNMQ